MTEAIDAIFNKLKVSAIYAKPLVITNQVSTYKKMGFKIIRTTPYVRWIDGTIVSCAQSKITSKKNNLN